MNKVSRAARIACGACGIASGMLVFKNPVVSVGLFVLGLVFVVGEALYYIHLQQTRRVKADE